MNSFTAIDFETAQGNHISICQIGLVKVRDGVITDELKMLVKPPLNHYWKNFTAIHGISAKDTFDKPTFKEVWPEIERFITNQMVVAHNGFRFDFPVLEKTLSYYGLAIPNYKKDCTYRIFKANLAEICKIKKIPLNHHDALSDARACAQLYLHHILNQKKH